MAKRTAPRRKLPEHDELMQELLNPRFDDPSAEVNTALRKDSRMTALLDPDYDGIGSTDYTIRGIIKRALDDLYSPEPHVYSGGIEKVINTFHLLMAHTETDPSYPQLAYSMARAYYLGSENRKRAAFEVARSHLRLQVNIATRSDEASKQIRETRTGLRKLRIIGDVTDEDLREIAMPIYEKHIQEREYANAAFVAHVGALDREYVISAAEMSITGHLQRGDYVGAADISYQVEMYDRAVELAQTGFDKYISNAVHFAQKILDLKRPGFCAAIFEQDAIVARTIDVAFSRLTFEMRDAVLVAAAALDHTYITKAENLAALAKQEDLRTFVSAALEL